MFPYLGRATWLCVDVQGERGRLSLAVRRAALSLEFCPNIDNFYSSASSSKNWNNNFLINGLLGSNEIIDEKTISLKNEKTYMEAVLLQRLIPSAGTLLIHLKSVCEV